MDDLTIAHLITCSDIDIYGLETYCYGFFHLCFREMESYIQGLQAIPDKMAQLQCYGLGKSVCVLHTMTWLFQDAVFL